MASSLKIWYIISMEKTNPLYVPALDGIDYTQEDLDFFLCGAFEGGSSYWIDAVEYGSPRPKGIEYFWESITRGGSLIIEYGSEEEEENKKELTQETFLKGLEIFFTKYFSKPKNKKETFDFADLDANDSDLVLQYSLFEEEIYC